MFVVPDNAPPEDKAITKLMNEGLDSRQLLRAAFTFHQLVLSQRLASKGETTIQSGCFKGTVLNPESFSSAFLPKYIGTYEREVQDHLSSISAPLDCFLNIGCADGFYLACIARWRRIPCIGVDIDPRSAAAINHVGQANGVNNLVSFKASISEAVAQLKGSVLILIDVDGAESKVLAELLDALAKNPLIKHAHLILETDVNPEGSGMNHPILIRSLCAQNWSIDQLLHQDPNRRFLQSYSHLSFLEQVVLASEGRYGKQCWIVASRDYNHESSY